jgi:hypothetical protein
MRRPRRFPHRILLVLFVLAALVGVPRLAHPSSGPGSGSFVAAAATAATTASASSTASSLPWSTGNSTRPISAVTVADRQPAAPPGGACSVPGIGDIGSLFGFCKLGQSGLSGDLNNICQPSLPDPEPANSGIDAMVRPPAEPGPQPETLYSSYGISGQYWAATNLQCSDMTSLIGNNVASMVFDIAKSIDRVTITVYQSAAGEGILSWLTNVVDKLISSLGNAIYFPYLAAVVILGAIWLAWQGLIRKRGTRTIEGTVWMVVACVAAIWLIGRPADFTGVGTAVTDGIGQTLNTAFSKLPAPSQSNCLPVTKTDPQVQPASFNFSSGDGVVAQNANELWTVLVCKPWLAGEFGTFSIGSASSPVNTYGRQLLWAQAIAANENPSNTLIQAKQATYSGIAASIQQKDPGIYPLFQGKQWTTRLEIAFAALFAAAIAGVLVLLIAVTLILLKLGFLLLLVVGPFFLLIGTHPGFGRVVALRWFEMLVGVLLKQAAVALVLSVLLYSYSLIMGTSEAVLPWALKILMIALVTVAVFIYRRPFQHLFSAVGYGMIGSTDRAEIEVQRHRETLRANTLGAAASMVPGVAAYRAARWARRGSGQGMAGTNGAGTADGATLSAEDAALAADGTGIAPPEGGSRAGSRSGLASRARAWAGAAAGDGTGRQAPPLNLPSRETAGAGSGARNQAAGSAAAAGRTAADAAAVSAAGGVTRAGAARPVASGQAQSGTGWPAAGSLRSGGPAAGGPRSEAPRPASPAPASSGPASASSSSRPASPRPSSPAPAGQPPARQPSPAPAPRPASGGSPWRPGVTPRPSAVQPPAPPAAASPAPAARPAPSAAPDPAPRSAGRTPGGLWSDSSAGRRSAAPPRQPAASQPAASPPAASQPPTAPPSPARPARAPRPGRQASAQPPARPADPAPRGSGSRGQSGPWADTAGRRSGAPPRQPGPPGRGPAPASRPGAESADGEGSPGPLAGRAGDRDDAPAPFWLRPRRRK